LGTRQNESSRGNLGEGRAPAQVSEREQTTDYWRYDKEAYARGGKGHRRKSPTAQGLKEREFIINIVAIGKSSAGAGEKAQAQGTKQQKIAQKERVAAIQGKKKRDARPPRGGTGWGKEAPRRGETLTKEKRFRNKPQRGEGKRSLFAREDHLRSGSTKQKNQNQGQNKKGGKKRRGDRGEGLLGSFKGKKSLPMPFRNVQGVRWQPGRSTRRH